MRYEIINKENGECIRAFSARNKKEAEREFFNHLFNRTNPKDYFFLKAISEQADERIYHYYSARMGDLDFRGFLEAYFFDNADKKLLEKILHHAGKVPMADVRAIMAFIKNKGFDYFFKCPALEAIRGKL